MGANVGQRGRRVLLGGGEAVGRNAIPHHKRIEAKRDKTQRDRLRLALGAKNIAAAGANQHGGTPDIRINLF